MQKLSDIPQSKLFSSEKNQAVCADATAQIKKLQAKLRQCPSVEVSSRKRDSRDMLSTSPGYLSLLFAHVVEFEKEGD